MRQVVYVSTASDIDRGDLKDILREAVRNNSANEITGLLLFNGENFLQVLEGTEAAIEQLLDKLDEDKRHSGMIVMADLKIDNRVFPSWAMRLVELSVSPAERREQLSDYLPPEVHSTVRGHMLNYAALN